jgi:hypothetical protein
MSAATTLPEERATEPTLELVPPVAPKVIGFDVRRPWPLGVPAAADVLQAIGAQAEVDGALQSAHLHVLSLLPEYLYDAARTSLAGSADPVAMATASAWRTLIAADHLDAALGVDQPALQELINEAVDAREKLIAAGYFALDGGAGAEELLTALGEAVERLVEKAGFRAKAPGTPSDTRLLSVEAVPSAVEPEVKRGRALRWAFIATAVVTTAFHLAQFATADAAEPWVVVGDVDRGHAFLAPGVAGADEASLQARINGLGAQGLQATRSASGEWVVQRIGKGTP